MTARAPFNYLSERQWDGLDAWVANKEPESLHLDFKQKSHVAPIFDDKDRTRLSEAISAFANTSGGVVIFGISTSEAPKSEPDRAKKIVPISGFDGFHRTVEEQIITLTDPPVAGLEILSIKDPNQPAAGVLAIYVPESDGGPHRTQRCISEVNERYFMRTSTNTSVMPHALLADRFGRRARPKPSIAFRNNVGSGVPPDSANLGVRLSNIGRGTAEGLALRLACGDDSLFDVNFIHGGSEPLHHRHIEYEAHYGREPAVFFTFRPDFLLYPGQEVYLGQFISKPFAEGRDRFAIRGTIYARDIQPVTFTFAFAVKDKEKGVFEVPRVI